MDVCPNDGSSMIASLSMYDWPELRAQTDAFWNALRERLAAKGLNASQALTRGDDAEALWLDPSLLFSQTCGYPFATQLRDKVRYVATPRYSVKGCEGATYSSAIIGHRDDQHTALADYVGARVAYNAKNSLSGYRCLKADVLGDAIDADPLISGGHRNSICAVAEERADIAAVDAVCWQLAQQFEPEAVSKLKVIGWTELRPALPFITSLQSSPSMVDAMRAALAEVARDDAARETLAALHIAGFDVLDEVAYAPLAEL